MTNLDGSTPAHELDEIEAAMRKSWLDKAFADYLNGEDHTDLAHGSGTLAVEIMEAAQNVADTSFVGTKEQHVGARFRYQNAVRSALNVRYTELEANKGSL